MSVQQALADLQTPEGGIAHPIYLACAEVINAAAKANHVVHSCSWFNPGSTPEHHVPGMAGQKGVANDFMVYSDHDTGQWIANYLVGNGPRLGICWVIWDRHIYSFSPGKPRSWQPYSGSNPHTDHVHCNFGHLLGVSGYGTVSLVTYHPPGPPKPNPDRPQPKNQVCAVEELHSGVTDKDSVWWAQHWLNWAPITGISMINKTRNYDGNTVNAVKHFQQQYSDPHNADGNLGPKETLKLFQLARDHAHSVKKDLPWVKITQHGKQIN